MMRRKIVKPINEYPWGGARTIKAQYNNTSLANFRHTGTWGATGVIEIIYEVVKQDAESKERIDIQG